jgi:malonate transporter
LSIIGLTLPSPVKAFGTLLGGAALPCALFALGASLVGQRDTPGKSEVAWLVALKLLAHPLVIWLLATHVFFLQPLWAKMAVIEAGLPTAASLFVLAEQYDLCVDRASAVVFASTLISVVTVSVLLGLMVGQ